MSHYRTLIDALGVSNEIEAIDVLANGNKFKKDCEYDFVKSCGVCSFQCDARDRFIMAFLDQLDIENCGKGNDYL